MYGSTRDGTPARVESTWTTLGATSATAGNSAIPIIRSGRVAFYPLQTPPEFNEASGFFFYKVLRVHRERVPRSRRQAIRLSRVTIECSTSTAEPEFLHSGGRGDARRKNNCDRDTKRFFRDRSGNHVLRLQRFFRSGRSGSGAKYITSITGTIVLRYNSILLNLQPQLRTVNMQAIRYWRAMQNKKKTEREREKERGIELVDPRRNA